MHYQTHITLHHFYVMKFSEHLVENVCPIKVLDKYKRLQFKLKLGSTERSLWMGIDNLTVYSIIFCYCL